MTEHAASEKLEPILPGKGASDYERYLRTDELLSLQRTPDDWAHRDEILFQTVHQSSELWLKHATFEVETATGLIRERDLSGAIRLISPATLLPSASAISASESPLRSRSWSSSSVRPR